MTAGLLGATVVSDTGPFEVKTLDPGPLEGRRRRSTFRTTSESLSLVLPTVEPLAASTEVSRSEQGVNTTPRETSQCRVDIMEEYNDEKKVVKDQNFNDTQKVPLQDASTDDDSEEDHYETDGKWAWLTLIGSFYIMGTVIPITPVFGILFSKRLPELGLGPHVIGWMFTVHAVVWSVSCATAKAFVEATSYRFTAMASCLLLSLFFMALAFARTALHFFILYGFLIPVTAAIGSTVPYLLVPRHFSARRGMAMGIMATGISVGGIVTPVLIRFLQDEYGFVGACLIHGAVLLNCCVGTVLFKPPQSKVQTLKSVTSLSPVKDTHMRVTAGNQPKVYQNRLSRKLQDTALIRWFITHFQICQDPRMILTCSSWATGLVGFSSFMSMIPFSLESHGYSEQFSAQCISTCYVSSTVARIIIAFTSDRPWFKKRALLICAATLISVSVSGMVRTPTSADAVLAFMAGGGAGFGAFIAVFHLNTLAVFGPSLYAFSVGIEAVFAAGGYVILGVVLDMIRSVSSGFGASMAVCAAFVLTSGLLWLLVPLAQRRHLHVGLADFR